MNILQKEYIRIQYLKLWHVGFYLGFHKYPINCWLYSVGILPSEKEIKKNNPEKFLLNPRLTSSVESYKSTEGELMLELRKITEITEITEIQNATKEGVYIWVFQTLEKIPIYNAERNDPELLYDCHFVRSAIGENGNHITTSKMGKYKQITNKDHTGMRLAPQNIDRAIFINRGTIQYTLLGVFKILPRYEFSFLDFSSS